MAKTYDVRLTLSDDENEMMKKLKNVYLKDSDDDDLTIHELATLLTYAVHILNFYAQEIEEALNEVTKKR